MGLSRERSLSPYRWHEQSRSYGHDDHLRSSSFKVKVMVEVNKRTSMMIVDIRGLRSEETVKTSITVEIILWHDLQRNLEHYC